MGKRLAALLAAPPPTRIGNFGDPVLSRLERASEAREAMRKVQQEWRREHAQVVRWSGEDSDEAQEIEEDIRRLGELLDRAERRAEEQATVEALAEGSSSEVPSTGTESHATTESCSPLNVVHAGTGEANSGEGVAARVTAELIP